MVVSQRFLMIRNDVPNEAVFPHVRYARRARVGKVAPASAEDNVMRGPRSAASRAPVREPAGHGEACAPARCCPPFSTARSRGNCRGWAQEPAPAKKFFVYFVWFVVKKTRADTQVGPYGFLSRVLRARSSCAQKSRTPIEPFSQKPLTRTRRIACVIQ